MPSWFQENMNSYPQAAYSHRQNTGYPSPHAPTTWSSNPLGALFGSRAWGQTQQGQRGRDPTQMFPGRYPQGSFPQRQPAQRGETLPQGQMPQGQGSQRQWTPFLQGQPHKGQLPQGQMSPGQPYQGQMPPGSSQGAQVPRSKLNPNALPDGIRLEPLDENTLKQLQNSGINGISGTGEPEVSSGSPEPGLPGLPELPTVGSSAPQVIYDRTQVEMADSLAEIIQGERNAALYYQQLSELTGHPRHRSILKEISGDCQTHHQRLNEIYKKYKGDEYAVKITPVSAQEDFYQGIALAIQEENKALRDLSLVYDQVNDEKVGKTMGAILYRKISCLSRLHFIHGHIQP